MAFQLAIDASQACGMLHGVMMTGATPEGTAVIRCGVRAGGRAIRHRWLVPRCRGLILDILRSLRHVPIRRRGGALETLLALDELHGLPGMRCAPRQHTPARVFGIYAVVVCRSNKG